MSKYFIKSTSYATYDFNEDNSKFQYENKFKINVNFNCLKRKIFTVIFIQNKNAENNKKIYVVNYSIYSKLLIK